MMPRQEMCTKAQVTTPGDAQWACLLELNAARTRSGGSEEALAQAIGRGADLRIYTEFVHNEHIDVTSNNAEPIQEVSEFGITYLLDDAWTAGIMSLRQPIQLPLGFGLRPSMSFFLYNQDGRQAIARPYLDGAVPSVGDPPSPADMPKYHMLDHWDDATNAPSTNFVYDFDVYRYCVWDGWREVLAHDENGAVVSGSLDALVAAFATGAEIKIAVRDLCADLTLDAPPLGHEVFVRVGPGYHYTQQRLFMAGSHPLVRVKPNIPVSYSASGWDFGWLMARTDGQVVYRRCDPYTLRFDDRQQRHALRWFVRGT